MYKSCSESLHSSAHMHRSKECVIVFLSSRVEEHTHELRQKTSTKIRLHNKHVCGCSLAIQCIFVQRSAKNIHKLISLRFVGSFHIQAGELLKQIFLKNVRIITHSSRVS